MHDLGYQMFGEVLGLKICNLGLGMRNFAQNSKEIAQKTIIFCHKEIGADSGCHGTGIKHRSTLNEEAGPTGNEASSTALRGALRAGHTSHEASAAALQAPYLQGALA